MDKDLLSIKLLELLTDDERNRYLRSLLSKNDCEITFTKINGDVRTMPCTLRTEAMPLNESLEYQTTRPYKPETLSVWCIDKSEWRSFRVANVTTITILNV